MALTSIKRLKYFTCVFVVLLLVEQIECGRSSGGSRSSSSHSSSHTSSSSHSTSHSSPSHSSPSHSSPSHSSFGSGTHSSSGGGYHSSPTSSFHPSSSSGSHLPSGGTSHTSFGGAPHSSNPTFGSGTHSSPPVTHFGPSAPQLPGYTVTGGTGFVPHPSGATKPIGFDHVNQQAHNTRPLSPPASTGGIGFDHHQQTQNNPLNSGKPGGTNFPQPSNPIHSAPPGYTVTGGAPINSKPGGIGFDHVNQQAHNTQLNNAKPLAPPSAGIGFQHPPNPVFNGPPGYTVTGGAPLPNKPTGAIGFDHVNQAHNTPLNAGSINTPHVTSPPVYGGISPKPAGAIGFDHVNQQAHNNINPSGGAITSQHYNPVHTGTGGVPSAPHYPSYPANTGSRPGIGFDHVNHQAAGVHPTYQPYRPQTIVQPSGYVHYQPPVQLQYAPPVTVLHSTTHYVPVYQPSIIQTYSSGGGSLLSHGGSFLGGYLIGRLSSDHGYYHSSSGYQNTHITNNYYNNDNNYYNGNTGSSGSSGGSSYNSYYTVHHYNQNREQVPTKFSVPGEDLTQCQANTTNQLCVPNTNAFCLRNGTIMCTTPNLLTTPCGVNSTEHCVYSRIDCNGNPACNVTANQTYIDFYLPCISNVTYIDNKVVDSTAYKAQGSYELCVTAIAHPKKLDSPILSIVNLFAELGKWNLEQLSDIHNKSNGMKRRKRSNTFYV